MGADDEQDETPIDARTPAAIERRSARQRPLVATEKVGRASLIHDGDERALRGRQRTATPPTGVTLPLSPDGDEEFPSDGTVAAVAREITNVEILKQRAMARLHKSSRFENRDAVIVATVIEELWSSMNHGQQRAADRDSEVLAARGGPDVGKRIDDVENSQKAITGTMKTVRGALVAVLVAVLGGAWAAAEKLDAAAEKRGAERAQFEHVRDVVIKLSDRQEQIRADLLVIKTRLGLSLAEPALGEPHD